LLDATAGPDVGAPYFAPPPEQPFLTSLERPPKPLRIGLQTAAFNGAPVDPQCIDAATTTATLCEQLGHHVQPWSLSLDAESLSDATWVIIAANVRATVMAQAEELGRDLRDDDLELGTWDLVRAAERFSAEDYARAVRTIHSAGRTVAHQFEHVDIILSPTLACLPPELGTLSLSNPNRDAANAMLAQTIGFTQLFNVAGNPAMSVPLGWATEQLPIGVQFAGRYADEATLLKLASTLEDAAPWGERTPDLSLER
ncbi:MAG: amidase family protein, partial [Pseudomonadota bacterium]